MFLSAVISDLILGDTEEGLSNFYGYFNTFLLLGVVTNQFIKVVDARHLKITQIDRVIDVAKDVDVGESYLYFCRLNH